MQIFCRQPSCQFSPRLATISLSIKAVWRRLDSPYTSISIAAGLLWLALISL
jgi:hypothetical protein